MTRRVLAGIFALRLVPALVPALAPALALAAACSSQPTSTEKTGSSGVADPADGCILVGDASSNGYPTLSDLPSGACDDSAKACSSLVDSVCGSCGMNYLALWDCTCASGTWSCVVGASSAACPPCASDGGGDDDAGDGGD